MTDTDVADLFSDVNNAASGSASVLATEITVFAPVPLAVRDIVLDPVFARRRDALLRTAPVHDIAARAERAETGLGDFDVRALTLAAFDAVIARQGFPDRTTSMQVLDLLAGIAAVQVPRAPAADCRRAATHVLDGLTNRRSRSRNFTPTAAIYQQGGDNEVIAERVPRPFWLLREAEDPYTGNIFLECSTDAVNALVGGLDLPLEDQQVALEYVLERQLARGELDAAHATAIQARRLTAGYIIQIDELLAETARDVRGTDWHEAAPQLIEGALRHIDDCLTREGRLLQHVAADTGSSSDAAATTDARRAWPGEPASMTAERRSKISAALTKLLTESRHLHTTLMTRLMGARGRFLDAQNDQRFRPTLPDLQYDLHTDLLNPALALHIDYAVEVTDAYLCGTLGPHTPVVLHWGDFVEALVHTPVDKPGALDAADDNDLFLPDPAPFIPRTLLAYAHGVLASVDFPARLSTLISVCPDAEDPGASVVDLFVSASLIGFDNAVHDTDILHPGTGSTPGAGVLDDHDVPNPATEPDGRTGAAEADGTDPREEHPVHLLEVLGEGAACIDDGTLLDGPGWSGNDLIVCLDRDQLDAVVLGDIPAPEPSRLGPTLRPTAWPDERPPAAGAPDCAAAERQGSA